LIADLGISSWQIDQADRGFSTRHDGRLDMRMDREQLQDAVSILNSYTPERLTQILRQYGEIENARRLAAELVSTRQALPITTTAGLKEFATRFAPRGKENQYLARVFQALRIEVNEELDSLREMLLQAADLLETGGRISVISYHSLEDRLVKNYFRSGNFEGIPDKDFFGRLISPLKPVNRKAITPSPEEVSSNPRARSARLRIAERN
jgi:16S rRNA (cytosine1402-N4)-methyltransferase